MFLTKIFPKNKGFWTEERKRSFYLALLLLALALVIQVEAGSYSARRAVTASFASDLFLDNLPVWNLSFVIVQGAIIAAVLSIILFMSKPKYLIFGTKAVALFVIVRSFFLNLTHIGIYPHNDFGAHGIGSGLYKSITFNGNFFFSGHTGLVFLLALIFWREKLWRRLYLALCIFFAVTVLLAHVHYSIDVFAAPFITYGVFKIAERFFPKDYAIMNGN